MRPRALFLPVLLCPLPVQGKFFYPEAAVTLQVIDARVGVDAAGIAGIAGAALFGQYGAFHHLYGGEHMEHLRGVLLRHACLIFPLAAAFPFARLRKRTAVGAVKGGAQLGRDLTSEQIKKLLSAESPENRALIITVIGGQGHIFGRGNQQLSPEVIKMFPRENITVAATPAKMAGLFGKSLIADTGDAALDEELKGYVPVVTGHSRRMMAKIG